MLRVHVRYRGRVQGVGFRATVVGIAQGHDVTGRVCNVADGTVDLQAEGEAGEVHAFYDAVLERLGRNIDDCDPQYAQCDARRWDSFSVGPDLPAE